MYGQITTRRLLSKCMYANNQVYVTGKRFASSASPITTIKNTLAENLGGPFQNLGQSNFTLDEVPDLSGKVAVVTGGTEGLGYGSAHTLLSKGIKQLFVTCNGNGENCLNSIEESLGADARKRVTYITVEQSEFQSLADSIKNHIAAKTDRLDILINNAGRGIMARQLNSDGIDSHMAVNHFGHVVITSQLLPLLKHTAKSGNIIRIVNVASNLHESSPEDTQFKTVEELNREYSPKELYGRSKLANICFTKYLDKHLHGKYSNILINAVHPGIVDTKQTSEYIHDAYPILGYGMSVLSKPFQKTQFEACVSSMYAATVTERSGEYIATPCIVEKGSDKANDPKLAENLMTLTREVLRGKVKLDDAFQ